VRGLPTAVSPVDPLSHDGADEGFAVHADREEITARLRERVASGHRVGGLGPCWQSTLFDHLPHLVGALAGALVADDRTVIDDAVLWLDDVMRHRQGPETVTGEVLAGLRAVMAEHPVATRMLSGQLRAAG